MKRQVGRIVSQLVSEHRYQGGEELLEYNASEQVIAEEYALGILEPECDDEAFDMYLRACESRDESPAKLFALGLCYECGIGTDMDLVKAAQSFAKAAEIGSFEALKRLKNLTGVPVLYKDLKYIFYQFKKKSDMGDERGHINAGFCYFRAIGTEENIKLALLLFIKAAEKNCADAMVLIDECRQDGYGQGFQGMEKLELLFKGAELGSAEAEYQLGNAFYCGYTTYGLKVEEDGDLSVKWLEKAVNEHHVEAAYELARCYYYEGESVKYDGPKFFYLCKKAALLGKRLAQYKLSLFYEHKWFMIPDDQWPAEIDRIEAIRWAKKAVNQKEQYTQINLFDILKTTNLTGSMVNKLISEPSSFSSRLIWYNFATCYENGQNVEKNEVDAFEMYMLSAKLGYTPAKAAVGRCYELGIGTTINIEAAIHWYEKAAINGDESSAESLLLLVSNNPSLYALKNGTPYADLALYYESISESLADNDMALLMYENAAINGDIASTELVVSAYSCSCGNAYRAKKVGSFIATLPSLHSEEYLAFLRASSLYGLDNLDVLEIILKTAAAVRQEICGIRMEIM